MFNDKRFINLSGLVRLYLTYLNHQTIILKKILTILIYNLWYHENLYALTFC